MRSFQQAVVFLFALFAFALAQDDMSYDATVYVTSTVFRVNTITLSGTPTGSVAEQTSTISAIVPSLAASSQGTVQPLYPSSNGTSPSNVVPTAPSGTTGGQSTSAAEFTGAASHLNINAAVAAIAAGVGYLAL